MYLYNDLLTATLEYVPWDMYYDFHILNKHCYNMVHKQLKNTIINIDTHDDLYEFFDHINITYHTDEWKRSARYRNHIYNTSLFILKLYNQYIMEIFTKHIKTTDEQTTHTGTQYILAYDNGRTEVRDGYAKLMFRTENLHHLVINAGSHTEAVYKFFKYCDDNYNKFYGFMMLTSLWNIVTYNKYSEYSDEFADDEGNYCCGYIEDGMSDERIEYFNKKQFNWSKVIDSICDKFKKCEDDYSGRYYLMEPVNI
jgi:hypothetical protein